MMKQKDIAQILNRDPSEISMLLTGKRKASWPFAAILSKHLPGKTIEQWKNAEAEELSAAFNLIEHAFNRETA